LPELADRKFLFGLLEGEKLASREAGAHDDALMAAQAYGTGVLAFFVYPWPRLLWGTQMWGTGWERGKVTIITDAHTTREEKANTGSPKGDD